MASEWNKRGGRKAAVFHGRPCKACGGTERYVNHGSGQCRTCAIRKARELRENNPELKLERERKRTTGWSTAAFTEQGCAQQWRCATCRTQKEPGIGHGDRFLKGDHCHRTQQPRMLLCNTCNTKIEPVVFRFMTDPDFRRVWENYLTCAEA